MGIRKLWDAVQSAGKHISLREFMINESIRQQNNGLDPLILGVDMQIILCECTAAVLARGIHGQFEGGSLRIFFNKLCRFRQFPGILVFVSDGNMRPSVKQGTQVITRDISLKHNAIKLIECFGYYHYTAPGEAEAELAELNRCNIIEGVLTTDSDTLVFGALKTFRMLQKRDRNYEDEVILYDANIMEEDLKLSQGGLLLYALLVGGDYDGGVDGCGWLTASGLVKCGLGDKLHEILKEETNRDTHLAGLRRGIISELRTNAKGLLECKHPTVAKNLPGDFPNQDIWHLYVEPITSWSRNENIPNHREWVFRQPNVCMISRMCVDQLRWNTEALLRKSLKSHLWECVLLQMLFSPRVYYNRETRQLLTPTIKAKVLSAKEKVRQGQFADLGPQARVTVSTANFIALLGHQFSTSERDTVVAWVPVEFVPEGIIDKLKSKSKKKKDKRTKLPVKEKGKKKESVVLDVNIGDGQLVLAEHGFSGLIHADMRAEFEEGLSGLKESTRTGDTMGRFPTKSGPQQGPSRIPICSNNQNTHNTTVEIDYTMSDAECLSMIQAMRRDEKQGLSIMSLLDVGIEEGGLSLQPPNEDLGQIEHPIEHPDTTDNIPITPFPLMHLGDLLGMNLDDINLDSDDSDLPNHIGKRKREYNSSSNPPRNANAQTTLFSESNDIVDISYGATDKELLRKIRKRKAARMMHSPDLIDLTLEPTEVANLSDNVIDLTCELSDVEMQIGTDASGKP